MAKRYFTPGEVVALNRLPPGARAGVLPHLDAERGVPQGDGMGLSDGLESFEVSVPPDDPAPIAHRRRRGSSGPPLVDDLARTRSGLRGRARVETHGLRVVPCRYVE